ncbi:MAG: hypothetical protein A2Y07_08245 [Planctomycetes bacterium GWF2_50_10]|nr:MAG: hypothetical protein A2Y07_08245 [Planctomycetes bacterium GWF2_50_10]
MVFSLFNNKAAPIGVDMGSEYIKMLQLGKAEGGFTIIGAAVEQRPAFIEAGSSAWQHWAIKAIKQLAIDGKFKGRKVVTAMPASDVFIDQIKIPKMAEEKVREAVIARVAPKLPFDPATAMVHYVMTGAGSESEYIVMATDRVKVDHHLAIYERAGLEAQAIAIWPLAMVWSYVSFFGRRKNDLESTVMLLEIGANFTKVVICKHSNLLFARLVNIGVNQLKDENTMRRLIDELGACARYFETQKGRIERMIFLTSQSTDKILCESVVKLARDLQVPAQIGDVLAAIEVSTDDGQACGPIERRGNVLNWTGAVGLGLFSEN